MGKKIQVIFLIVSHTMPSSRFRVKQYLGYLNELGIEPVVREIPKKLFERLRLFRSLSSYDIVFLQKRLFQKWLLKLIRMNSHTLVYDFDDAVLYRDSNSRNFNSFTRRTRFVNTVTYADHVIAGNPYLKHIADRYSANVTVIPTGIDADRYVPTAEADVTPPFTIGWIGSRSNLMLLKQLVAPLNELYRLCPNFRLKIVCDDFIDGFDCPVEKKLWREEDEIADIQSFHIGVMPLVENQWTKGKCALKLLQYMACGLPSVATATAVTSAMIREAENGFLIHEPSQWVEKLKFLLENSEHFHRLGQNARCTIMGRYDARTVAGMYADVFHGLLHA